MGAWTNRTLQSTGGRIRGGVVLVVRHGRLAHFEALGTRDPGTGNAMVPDSIFRLYSMTVPIVSTPAIMLFEEGCFDD